MTEAPAADPHHPLPATVIGGYRVVRRLAGGSTGTVYLAIDERLGRYVALKLLDALDQRTTEQLLEEARLTARFNHPNIVTVYAAGVWEGRAWLALEHLDGQTLRARLDAGPLAGAEILRLGRSIARALAEAHARGLVHADLKPDNVLIPADGRARVVDFGLSVLVASGTSTRGGTPAYMAPERWLKAPTAPPVDVWALGLMLCEAFDGQRPYSERDLLALAYQPKAPTLGVRAAASPFAATLARCLAHQPAERPTAAELAQALGELLSRRPPDDARSPFRGLSAFTEADAADYQGREDETDAIIEQLRGNGLVTVVGPSGVGKSSFLAAGLTPRLRELGPHVVLSTRPGRRPTDGVEAALAAHGVQVSLAAGPGELLRGLRAVADNVKGRALLVIDQFEELLTLSAPAEAEVLLRALLAPVPTEEPVRVVLGLRADFLGNLAQTCRDIGDNGLLGSAGRALLVLQPLSPQAIERAVTLPLARVGYQVDRPTLPTQIAAELTGQPSALPLLQFAMDALWRRRDAGARLLLGREYDAMGGALGALASHAEQVTLQFSEAQRKLTRALMLELVAVDGTRRPRTRQELLAAVGPGAAEVLDQLTHARLLTAGADEAQELVELVHESLSATWPALIRWLAETKEARTFAEELTRAAGLWGSRGKREEETWQNDALRDARHRAGVWGLTLSPLQEAFLAAGEARERLVARRRRWALMAAFAGLSALALVMLGTTLLFREKERVAIEQQAEIRRAAADMGRFELSVGAFDWDLDDWAPKPVDAKELALVVRFRRAGKDDVTPGPLLEPEYQARETPRFENGQAVETLELGGGAAWIEVDGRGRSGERCAPSLIHAKKLPGFRERGALERIALTVPTCAASRAGMVEIAAGPYVSELRADGGVLLGDLPRFRASRLELTREELAPLVSLAAVTGEAHARPPPTRLEGSKRLPVGFVSRDTAVRACLYWGKRLQSSAEYVKAARGGTWLDEAHAVRNPSPNRPTPWGDLDGKKANLAPAAGDGEILPSGATPTDRSPYGVMDLGGNVREWTSTDGADTKLAFVHGGSALEQEPHFVEYRPYLIDRPMSAHPTIPAADLGLRCSSE